MFTHLYSDHHHLQATHSALAFQMAEEAQPVSRLTFHEGITPLRGCPGEQASKIKTDASELNDTQFRHCLTAQMLLTSCLHFLLIFLELNPVFIAIWHT